MSLVPLKFIPGAIVVLSFVRLSIELYLYPA